MYISAFQSTRKVRDIEKNARISVLIDTDRPGEPAQAVLLEGAAELLSDPEQVSRLATSIYTRYLGAEGVLAAEPQSWIGDPENRIIKLTPEKAFIWGQPES
ncbi:MAG: pyridoxamine 5'-phosphate oxidase family protein [Anaerolineales bacterium]|nr:pyridoxamine 5'-phosphate oxidase family protein [Anaerolineales bacterium]